MYKTLLKTSWNDMQNSDYVFKSNSEKRIVEIFGKEFNKEDDSLIIVYYNVYTQTPMLLVQRYMRHGVTNPPEVDGFSLSVLEDVNNDGTNFTEIVYICETLQKALEE